MKEIVIKKENIQFKALSVAGIISELKWTNNNGITHEPFYINPWLSENLDIDSPLLRYIQGEFFCLPFGGGRLPETDNWVITPTVKDFPDPHGYGTAHEWDIKEVENGVELYIEYPDSHPIKDINKKVTIMDDNHGLDFQVTIRAKYNVDLPFGIHPIIPLSKGNITIESSPFQFGYTLPAPTEKNISTVTPDSIFNHLNQVPTFQGQTIDLSSLPLLSSTEEIVQLCGIEGWIKVHFKDYSISFNWDSKDMPSCLLWISNRGRSYSPWNSRNLCLGIEPICGAFDLTLSSVLSDNPINQKGIPTYRTFTPQPYTLKYNIRFH